MRSGASASSLTPSDDPPDFEEAQSDPVYMEPLEEDDADGQFGGLLGGPTSNRNSPASSLDAGVDFANPAEMTWNDSLYSDIRSRSLSMRRSSPSASDPWVDSGSNLASPSYSNASSENTNETGQKTFTTAVEDLGSETAGKSP